MTNYVLVHEGSISTETWNRYTAGDRVYSETGYLGGRCWDPVVPALEVHNHQVLAPTLSDEATSSLTDHITQICSLIAMNDLWDTVLVGHSYGGMVITGVAARMPDMIRRLVYVDAALPDPGQSLYDLLSSALSGSERPPDLPGQFPCFVEPLHFDPVKLLDLPKIFILCTKSEFFEVVRIGRDKVLAVDEGWTYIELPSSHIPMAEMPDALIRILLDAA